MKDYLKSYRMCLETTGPLFIGSGKEISKKEYIISGKEATVLNIEGLYSYLKRRNLANSFENYLLNEKRDTLKTWLFNNHIQLTDVEPYTKYRMHAGDTIIQKGKSLQVMECIKDVYGNPYIPGSSIKGMLRTVLISSDILEHQEKYRKDQESISRAMREERPRRNYFMKKEIGSIEARCLRTLQRKEKTPADAVNDVLSGLIIGDSNPLSTNDLTLCQKVEVHTDGTEKRLNLLRECIKPGTKIEFRLTIDKSLCPYSLEDIMNAAQTFGENYYECFIKAFGDFDCPKKNTVYLGGGSGYVSKTITYPIFGKREGVKTVQKIFEKTNVPRQHKHDRDVSYGVSPHIIKCTRYNGNLYEMGKCRLICMD